MAHAQSLLGSQADLALQQVEAILEVAAEYPPALLLQAIANRLLGNNELSLQQLASLSVAQPNWAAAQFEYGIGQRLAGHGDEALKLFERTAELKDDHPVVWRLIADHRMAAGDSEGGDLAYNRHVRASTKDPELVKAASAMVENDVPVAEKILKAHLQHSPTNVAAIRMLAEVAARYGRNQDAETLLQRCIELAPGFDAARYNYAMLLHRRNQSGPALEQIEALLERDPTSPSYRNLCAVILSRIGEYERSSELYAGLLEQYPANAKVWLSYGHVLKTEGRREDCEAAYRESIARDGDFGEAYWSLANLKTLRFSDADYQAMHSALKKPALEVEHSLHFHFALGKAYEDAEDFAASWAHYAEGNALQSSTLKYDAQKNSARIERLKGNFTTEFFAARKGSGVEAADPIFIVGMPRAGSTLLEQILSSHSMVEGTTELPDIITMAKDLREESDSDEVAAYSEVLAEYSAEQLRDLGQQYLESTRIHRKTDKPLFIDKMPNNFLHVGMIHAILPNAKIIDARRHPLSCCFSNFKQYYARGQSFSYSLEDMALFYRDYVSLMSHYDKVLPGRVHRVFYENTVQHTEREVRRMLEYCGLPFEAQCLRFFENRRPVRTASSEQVRQPIYTQGMEQWENYVQWLDPLKTALGEVLEAYPSVPESA